MNPWIVSYQRSVVLNCDKQHWKYETKALQIKVKQKRAHSTGCDNSVTSKRTNCRHGFRLWNVLIIATQLGICLVSNTVSIKLLLLSKAKSSWHAHTRTRRCQAHIISFLPHKHARISHKYIIFLYIKYTIIFYNSIIMFYFRVTC